MTMTTAALLDGNVKGFPPGHAPLHLETIGKQGWSAGTPPLPLPLLVARESALAANIATMQRFCDERSILLAPHGKTTMSPQLFARQLQAGAWGITVGTTHQFGVAVRAGVRRVIIANQICGQANFEYIAREHARDEDLEIYVFLDSIDGARALALAVAEQRVTRPLKAFIEAGYAGGRTGVRSVTQALALADELHALRRVVKLEGIAGFEGLLSNDRAGRGDTERFLMHVRRLGDMLCERGDLPEDYLISAGGSSAFDLVAEHFGGGARRVVLRSGCYITHDHGLYAASPAAEQRFEPALELWSCVQSRPEPDLLYLNFGRRDAPFDAGFPVPLYSVSEKGAKTPLAGWAIEGLNDQHARVRLPPGEPAAVGDVIVCGISHPCGAFDRWKMVYVVNDDDGVADALLTYF